MDRMDSFAALECNGHLPAWWYYCQAVRMVALYKDAEEPAAGGTRDVRPIGVGNVRRRAVARWIVASLRTQCEKAFFPVQFCCGVADGAQKALFALRAAMEANPSYLLIQTDKKNAYNEVMRTRIVEALLGMEGFEAPTSTSRETRRRERLPATSPRPTAKFRR